MAVTAPLEFDARTEAMAHSTLVLLRLRRVFLVASVLMIAVGGALIAYELYRAVSGGIPPSDQLPSIGGLLVVSVAFVAAGVYLLAQCPAFKRPLPTFYRLDPDGFTAKWDDGTATRVAWEDPKLRLFMHDLREVPDVEGCSTLISRAGSFVPLAVPSKLYDRVLSEVSQRGLVTKARFYRGRLGAIVHTATVRGRKHG